ncbi:MAG: hypothetical protein [Circular genetic element sp.]|nr:MAG: hypothetical protein [Circular genetic element sp.]
MGKKTLQKAAMAGAQQIASGLLSRFYTPKSGKDESQSPFPRGRRHSAPRTRRSNTVVSTRNKKKKSYNMSYNATPSINYNHGKALYISPKFIRAVKQAGAAVDVQHFKGVDQFTSLVGECNYSVPHVLYDPTHIQTMNNNAGNFKDGKFLVRRALSMIQLVNARNSCATIRVYECEARSDVPYKSGTYVSPYNYLTLGWDNASLSSMLNNISGNAFSSSAFTTWFKVLDVKVISLNPGECKIFTLEDKSSTLINMERWFPNAEQLSIAHGRKTKFLMFQYWGQTVNDSTNTVLVSTDAVKIDCIHTLKYEYQYIQDTNATVYSTGTFNTVSTPEFINENTSAVVTGASA